MSLEAHVVLRKGTLDLDAEITAADDQVVVLLGPNAAGKTTILRALAGLIPLEAGKKINSLIKGSKIVILDKCGHVPQEEKPESVINEIENFVN